MSLLITPADKAFSLCVRERAHWRCERCLRETPTDKRMGLHCSHWIGRGSWGTRFHPLNSAAHCYGCHAYFEGRPQAHTDWMKERIGEEAAEHLVQLGNKPAYGIRKRVKDIAKFYRGEHRQQLELRLAGFTGYAPFSISPDVPDFDLLASRNMETATA